MKSLDEVEARINIQRTISPLPGDANYHYIISAPGSYYLSANLDVSRPNGIHVTSAGVTIDLNGFQIARSSGSGGEAITIDGVAHRCTIKNGSIHGFSIGARCLGGANTARGGSFLQLSISGCTGEALFAGQGWQVDGCEAHNNPGVGIATSAGCTVTNCTVSGNQGSFGITAGNGSTVANCTASNNDGVGIHTGLASTLANCTSFANAGSEAISIGDGSSMRDCTASFNSFTGIKTGHHCLIAKCAANENLGNGMNVGDVGVVESCQTRNNGSDNIVSFFNSQISHCTASGSVAGNGINAGPNSAVSDCSANFNGLAGIRTGPNCTVTNSTASQNLGHGFNLDVRNRATFCVANTNTLNGISALTDASVTQCTAVDNHGIGILASNGCTVRQCTASSNDDDGIRVSAICVVSENHCNGNGLPGGTTFSGVRATDRNNRIEGNYLMGNRGHGVKVDLNGNIIVRNVSASFGAAGTTDYELAANNKVGPIVFMPNSPAVSGGTGGIGLGSTDPLANFTY